MGNLFAPHRWAEEHLNQMRGLAPPPGRIFEDYERAMSVAHLLPPPQIIDHARQIAQRVEIGGDLHEHLTRTFGTNVSEGLGRMDPFHGIYGDLQRQIARWHPPDRCGLRGPGNRSGSLERRARRPQLIGGLGGPRGVQSAAPRWQ